MSSSDSKSAFNRLFFLYFSDVSHHVFLWLYKIYFSLRLTLCWGGRSAMLRADPRSIIIISSPGKRPSLKYTRLGHLSSSFHQHILVSTKPSLMSTKVCTFNKHPDKSYEHTAAMAHFVYAVLKLLSGWTVKSVNSIASELNTQIRFTVIRAASCVIVSSSVLCTQVIFSSSVLCTQK